MFFLPEYEDAKWNDLKVPGHWGMINAYSNYTGKGWYRKHFFLPDSWRSSTTEQIRLKFEGVYHVARVFVNGEYVGRHQGGFTPFEFEVSDLLHTDKENVVAVEADNNYLVGATWNWGGIIREVTLVKSSTVRIAYQYIHAEPDLTSGEAALKIKLRLENNSAERRKISISSKILDQEILTSVDTSLEIAPHSLKEVQLSSQLSADQVKLWHFDTPHLYEIKTVISENERPVHSKTDRFGIRKIEITPGSLVLNGEPVRLAGFNRVSDHRYWGSSEPQALINQDVELMKNAGANFMRIMHGTQNKKLLDRCDEKGILVIEEVNVRELTNPEFIPPDYPLAKQWLKEMIDRGLQSSEHHWVERGQ